MARTTPTAVTSKPPKRTLLDFTLRGLDEVNRFPTQEARARALLQLSEETNGWEIAKGIVIAAAAMAGVVVLIRTGIPRILPGVIGPFILKDISLLAGIATLLFFMRWLHRRGAARALRPKLIAAGVPVCVECGQLLHGLPPSTLRCPECGCEITDAARGLLNEQAAKE